MCQHGHVGPELEHALIERARGGDVDAFAELYRAHVALVRGYISRHFRRCDADEVTAETFVRAWEARARFEWRGIRYKAWLLRIARNLAVGGSRSEGRFVQVEAAEVAAAPAPLPEPGDAVVDRWQVAALREMVEALPALQRDVVVLRFVEGLSAVEVALVLDRRQEAVRSAQYRALQTLRAKLSALDAAG